MLKWISEAEALPPIGQPVFYIAPRQAGEHWDVHVARILVHHEAVHPHPVKPGDEWPTDAYWSMGHFNQDHHLITGNGWWAWMDEIPLPPGAEHRKERGQHWIAQPVPVFATPKR